MGGGELCPDMSKKDHVRPLTQARLAYVPGVISPFTDIQKRAGTPNRDVRLLFRDDLEFHFRASLAKKAAAF
jgi:hypothetical protein